MIVPKQTKKSDFGFIDLENFKNLLHLGTS